MYPSKIITLCLEKENRDGSNHGTKSAVWTPIECISLTAQANMIHQWKMFGAGPGSCEDIFLLECQGQVTRAA